MSRPLVTGNATMTDIVWYACASSSIVMATISVYLLLCVTLFVCRQMRLNASSHLERFANRPGRRSTNGHSASSEVESYSNERRATVGKVNYKSWKKDPGRWMYLLLMVSFSFNFVRVLEEQLLMYLGIQSDEACNVLGKAMIVITALTIHSCHVFLWCRQLAFYGNPLLRHIRSKGLQAFSFLTYFLMLGSVSAALFLHLWWRDYGAGVYGCSPIISSLKVQPYVPFAFLASSTVTVQACLTFLFVYPIVSHNKNMKSPTDRKISRNGSRSSTNAKSSKRLMKCVKRALFSSTVGISTDAIGALVAIWIPQTTPLIALSVLYELNILLNLLCLLYTYTNWKSIVFPFSYCGYSSVNSSS